VDGTNAARAEDIGQIGRDCRETAAVHREDDAEAGTKNRHVPRSADAGNRRVEDEPREEKDRVQRPAADTIGERRPEEAAENIKQTQEPREPGGHRGDTSRIRCVKPLEGHVAADEPTTENLLQHRRGHADHADSCRDIETEDEPQEPELTRSNRLGGRE
jgi:hypothetical protein